MEAQFRESKIGVPAADGGFIAVAGGRRNPQKRPGCDTCPDAEGDSSHQDFGVSSCYRPVKSLHPERLRCIVPQRKWRGGNKRDKIMKKSRLGRGSEPNFCLLLAMR